MDSYRGMNREALDRAYNNVAAVPDVADTMADFGLSQRCYLRACRHQAGPGLW